MFALPLLWAANATNGFLAWWPGLRWPYGVAALAASLDVLLRPAARNPWKFMDLWAGPILAIGWVVLFASFLREVFPLFSPSLHDRVMHACMVYSGGLLIGQAAWGTYLEGE